MRVRVRRFLAVPTPQLLLSSACAIVLTMKASPTAAFPHRGLAPHQFTPMSGAHRLHRTPRLRLGCMPVVTGAGSVSRNDRVLERPITVQHLKRSMGLWIVVIAATIIGA